MYPAQRRLQLRKLLGEGRRMSVASVFDPLTARMAEQIGFDVAMLGGSIASYSVLGDPDLTLITLTELAEQTRRISRAANIPLFVDADNGYGNALNVRRTVQELEAAGVAGLTIEDTELPARFGESQDAVAIPLDEAIGKVEAALDARLDSGLVIVGRTNMSLFSDPEMGAERLRAYAQIGVDAVWVSGIRTAADCAALIPNAGPPLIVGPMPDSLDNETFWTQANVCMRVRNHKPFEASVAAAYRQMLREFDGEPDILASEADDAAILTRFSRLQAFRAMEQRFLGRS